MNFSMDSAFQGGESKRVLSAIE